MTAITDHKARLNGDRPSMTEFRRAHVPFLDWGPEIVMALRTGRSASC